MSPAALALGCVIAVLAALVVTAAIRAWADVRIAAHTGVDPRADREAAKRSATAPMALGEAVAKIERHGNPTKGGSQD